MVNRHNQFALRGEVSIRITMLSFGVLVLILTFFYDSLILLFIGISLVFWASLLFYVRIKHIPIEILNAIGISAMDNTERILSASQSVGKGVYLSPNYLDTYDDSLVLVPLSNRMKIPTSDEIKKNSLYLQDKNYFLLTPPGFELCRLFERKLGCSFAKITFEEFLEKLPILLIDKIGIAHKVDIVHEEAEIIITLTDTVLFQLCKEMNNLPMTHKILGCSLTSAIACAIVKTTGESVSLEKEEQIEKSKTIKIHYLKQCGNIHNIT